MIYNTSVQLWTNYRESLAALPNGGAVLQVHDGHIGNGMECLARFPDSDAAIKALKAAGFVEISPNKFKSR